MLHKNIFERLPMLMAPAVLGLFVTGSLLSAGPKDSDTDIHTFKMVVSAGAKECTPNASATVSIRPAGQVEIMDVSVEGLPPNTNFDFFVIQVPKAPFGVAWYQGDIQTNHHGRGHQEFVGRFSIETFAVAQGTASAPDVFGSGPFPDASLNPPFEPVQMYHLGLWFDSPQAASATGCPATVTRFNGEHNAGIQVLNTSNFTDGHGPLLDVNPSAVKP